MGQTNKQILRFCVYKLDLLLQRNNVNFKILCLQVRFSFAEK